MKPDPIPSEIGDDELVTLKEACALFFGGRISPSALRTEAAKGRLEMYQIARKDFVTRRGCLDMMKACVRPSPSRETTTMLPPPPDPVPGPRPRAKRLDLR